MHEKFVVGSYESADENLQMLEENYVHIHEKNFRKVLRKLLGVFVRLSCSGTSNVRTFLRNPEVF